MLLSPSERCHRHGHLINGAVILSILHESKLLKMDRLSRVCSRVGDITLRRDRLSQFTVRVYIQPPVINATWSRRGSIRALSSRVHFFLPEFSLFLPELTYLLREFTFFLREFSFFLRELSPAIVRPISQSRYDEDHHHYPVTTPCAFRIQLCSGV